MAFVNRNYPTFLINHHLFFLRGGAGGAQGLLEPISGAIQNRGTQYQSHNESTSNKQKYLNQKKHTLKNSTTNV